MALFKDKDPIDNNINNNHARVTTATVQTAINTASMSPDEFMRYQKSQELLKRTEEMVRSPVHDVVDMLPQPSQEQIEKFEAIDADDTQEELITTESNNIVEYNIQAESFTDETITTTDVLTTTPLNADEIESKPEPVKPTTLLIDEEVEEVVTPREMPPVIDKPVNQQKLPPIVTSSDIDAHIDNVSNNKHITAESIQSQFNIPDTDESELLQEEAEELDRNRLMIPTASREEINIQVKALMDKYKDDEDGLHRELDDPDSFLSKVMIVANMLNSNQKFEQSSINHVPAETLMRDVPEFKSHTTSTFSQKSIPTDKYVSGEQARMFVASKVRGMKKVPLPNSGFHIWIRPLNNFELNEFVNSLYSETTTFGKLFGVHYYLFSDFLVKRFIMDRLGDIVTGSSLVGWKQKGVLVNNIKLPDYKVIIWAIVTLMYKEGVTFTKICGKCGNTEEVVLNLNNLYFCNYDILTKNDAQMIMAKNTSVTADTLKQYHDSLVFDVSNSIKVGDWVFKLKIPSLEEYIIFADMFYASLLKYCQVTDAIGIQNFNRFNFYKHYAPWIEEIQYINAENNDIEFRIKDAESIMENLSTYEFEETDFLEQLQNYISKVQIAHIAFNYVACPKCNHVPEDCKNGFIAYDVQSAFFTMSTMKLRRIT